MEKQENKKKKDKRISPSNNARLIRGLIAGGLVELLSTDYRSGLEIISLSGISGWGIFPIMDKFCGYKDPYKTGHYNAVGFFAGASAVRFVKQLFRVYGTY